MPSTVDSQASARQDVSENNVPLSAPSDSERSYSASTYSAPSNSDLANPTLANPNLTKGQPASGDSSSTFRSNAEDSSRNSFESSTADNVAFNADTAKPSKSISRLTGTQPADSKATDSREAVGEIRPVDIREVHVTKRGAALLWTIAIASVLGLGWLAFRERAAIGDFLVSMLPHSIARQFESKSSDSANAESAVKNSPETGGASKSAREVNPKGAGSSGAGKSRAGGRPIAVGIADVEIRDVPQTLNGLGTVTAFNTVTVKSRVDGELKNVFFQEGDFVEQGSPLAELDSRPFESALAQAEGQLTRDQATLQLSQLTLSRLKSLAITDAASQQEIDEQNSLYKQNAAIVAIDQANVENAKLQLSYTKITSPIAGRVGLRLVDRGNIVKAQDPGGLVVIIQQKPISVVFTIPQDEIPRLQKRVRELQVSGEEMEVEAFNRNFETHLAKGKLAAFDNQVDALTGTLKLKARFENDQETLFPNQFVNARLLVDTLNDIATVPASAVQRGPDFRYVYVVRPSNDDPKIPRTVELRKVEVGPNDGTRVAIFSGLSRGETVVVDGIDKLQPESKVIVPQLASKQKKPAGDNSSDQSSMTGGDAKPPAAATSIQSVPKT